MIPHSGVDLTTLDCYSLQCYATADAMNMPTIHNDNNAAAAAVASKLMNTNTLSPSFDKRSAGTSKCSLLRSVS